MNGAPKLEAFIDEQIRRGRFEALPLTLAHALRALASPDHHKDPFDRALIAQAQVEEIPLLSADRLIARYPIEVIW